MKKKNTTAVRWWTMSLLVPLAFAATPRFAQAVVIRSDVPDARYLTSAEGLPALAYIPDEGHGTLIAPQWVVTAAHAVTSMRDEPSSSYVVIAGKRRDVDDVVFYPDYQAAASNWKTLFDQMKTADLPSWMLRYDAAMGSMHDIALLHLKNSVRDVAPLPVYRGRAEVGQIAEIYGAGATGTSVTGAADNAPHRGALRHAENRISAAKDQWIRYVFDCGATALPLEGVIAGGDSGGPVLINVRGTLTLAGLAHGMDGSTDDVRHVRAGSFHPGVCGQTYASTRVSFYAKWIDQTMAAEPSKLLRHTH